MTELSDAIKIAILRSAEDTHAEARETYKDDPDLLRQIHNTTTMLYELNLDRFESGYHDGVLAAVWDEAYVAGAMHGLGPLAVENPYV